jgi:CRP/FNR family transcriptional regulator, cyclic AMP receptor protein
MKNMRKVLFLLSELSDSDLDWMVTHGSKQHCPKATVLVAEGRSVEHLFVVLDGAFEITASQLGDKSFRLSCGDIVGEVSLLDSRPPTATVTALVDSVVLALTHDDLKRRLAEDTGFGARFYRALGVFLAHRLRNTYQLLGYGKGQPMDEDVEYADELSPELLDHVHLAGLRFDRALRQLLSR